VIFGFLGGLLSLLFSVLWIVFLFRLGSCDKSFWFFSLLFSPYLLSFLFFILFGFPLIFTNFVSWWFMLFIFVVERIFWGLTLFDAAGFDRPLWFVFIFVFPVVGWVFYRLMLLQN